MKNECLTFIISLSKELSYEHAVHCVWLRKIDHKHKYIDLHDSVEAINFFCACYLSNRKYNKFIALLKSFSTAQITECLNSERNRIGYKGLKAALEFKLIKNLKEDAQQYACNGLWFKNKKTNQTESIKIIDALSTFL